MSLPNSSAGLSSEFAAHEAFRRNVATPRAPEETKTKLEVEAILTRIPVFTGLESRAVALLAARGRRRRVGQSVLLYQEGEPSHTIYAVVIGHVSVQRELPSGEIVPLALYGPGDLLGDLDVIDQQTRSADALTLEACELLALNGDDFRTCVHTFPCLSRALVRLLAQRMRTAMHWHSQQQTRSLLSRLSSVILELQETYGTEDVRGMRCLRITVTQQQIAHRLGVTRETVNRKLALLRQSGAIRIDGRRLLILNEQKLRVYSVYAPDPD